MYPLVISYIAMENHQIIVFQRVYWLYINLPCSIAMVAYQRVQYQCLIFSKNRGKSGNCWWIKDHSSNWMKLLRKWTRSLWHHHAITKQKNPTSSKIHRKSPKFLENHPKLSRRTSKNLQKIIKIREKENAKLGSLVSSRRSAKPLCGSTALRRVLGATSMVDLWWFDGWTSVSQ